MNAQSNEAAELWWTANAYLDGAILLCASMLEEGNEDAIHGNRVPVHLAYLALELFYKAGLSKTVGNYPQNHNLVVLRELYNKSAPKFPLAIPSYLETFVPKSVDMFDDAPSLSLHFTRFRYYADRKGNVFPKLDMANIQELHDELDLLHRSALKMITWITN